MGVVQVGLQILTTLTWAWYTPTYRVPALTKCPALAHSAFPLPLCVLYVCVCIHALIFNVYICAWFTVSFFMFAEQKYHKEYERKSLMHITHIFIDQKSSMYM